MLREEAGRRGIRIEHGKRLVGAAETADGVTARFDDGTEATGDILIGADGIRSTVRRLIDASAPDPSYTGLISFGARVANPVGRVIFALAMTIFTKLAKPEKMAWMFDYRIDWDAPVAPALQAA